MILEFEHSAQIAASASAEVVYNRKESKMSSDLIKVVTPLGELHYVNISGQGKENYDEDDYEYVASIRLTGDAAEKLKAEIEEIVELRPKGDDVKSRGYKELVKTKDGNLRSPTLKKPKTDDEEATGIFEFLFKTNTTYADGKTKKIGTRNAANQPVSLGNARIGNGTIGCISGKMRGKSYKKEWSVTLYLNAVQITKFVEYVGDDGFEAQKVDEDSFMGIEDAETGFVGQPEGEAPAEPEETPKAKVKPKL